MTQPASAWEPSQHAMRIELATSEIEGGPCRAWADPAHVLAAVAVSTPSDAFARYVEPRLEELDSVAPEGGELPAFVEQLIERLRRSHQTMVRDNAGRDEPQTIAITCAAAEENRVYFLKSAPAWIGILRGGKAFPVEKPDFGPMEIPVGLGADGKLGLEVTSLPVQREDVVVLLCSDTNASPDLRAMASVFAQTSDLKRACDGLVNLLGLQSAGAGAIAFRFVPVGGMVGRYGENPLAGLGRYGEAAPATPSVAPSARIAPRGAQGGANDPFADMTRAMPHRGHGGGRSEAESFLDSLGPPGTPSSESAKVLSGPWRDSLAEAKAGPGVHLDADPASLSRAHGGSEPVLHARPHGERAPASPGLITGAIASPQVGYGPGSQSGSHLDAMARADAMRASAALSGSASGGSTSPYGAAAPNGHAPSASAPHERMHALSHVHPLGPPPAPRPEYAPQHDEAAAPAPPAVAPSTSSSKQDRPGGQERWDSGSKQDRPGLRGGFHNVWPILVALLVGVALALVALPGGPGRDMVKDLFGGAVSAPTGDLTVRPDPPARQVLLDGTAVAAGTPANLTGIAVGRHRIGLDFGPLGTWETEIEVKLGANELAPHLTGSVRVASADPSQPGTAWVQGGERIAVPGEITGLPVGWTRVFYEDPNVPIWERQVLVRADRVEEVVVPNDLAEGEGLIRVEALAFWEGRGLQQSAGDSVWVDDGFSGFTPLEMRLLPGLHSVRVRASSGDSHTEMVDLHSGSARYVLAKFGAAPRPELRHLAPGSASVGGSLVLTVEVANPGEQAVARPTLHFPKLDASVREVPLRSVDAMGSVYVGVVDPRKLPQGVPLQYYFSAIGPSGDSLYSNLYQIVVTETFGSAGRMSWPRSTGGEDEGGSGAPAQTPQYSARDGKGKGSASASSRTSSAAKARTRAKTPVRTVRQSQESLLPSMTAALRRPTGAPAAGGQAEAQHESRALGELLPAEFAAEPPAQPDTAKALQR